MKVSKYNCKNLLSSLIKDKFTLFLKKIRTKCSAYLGLSIVCIHILLGLSIVCIHILDPLYACVFSV
jgi:hypothetical protein